MISAFKQRSPWAISWAFFLLVMLCAIAVAAGFPFTPILILGALVGILFAFRFIYLTLYLGFFLTPFLGLMLSVPTGSLIFGQRAFGGSIDISLAEVVLFLVLFAWSLKLIFLWRRRRDWNWQPKLPLVGSYLSLVAAHLFSTLSPLLPDPVLIVKFCLRPIAFNYLAFIALPVNLIRSRRRLVAATSALALVGSIAALDGLIAMFFPHAGGVIGRAHPLSIFGVSALGENHNELADLLVWTAPLTLALARLVKTANVRRVVTVLGIFQIAIGLFTFTRTIWMVFAIEACILGATHWREMLKKHVQSLIFGLICLLPLAFGMFAYSISDTAKSSNSTRLMLSQIAFQLFASSPWVGAGAGTFYDRVGSTSVFLLEYGDPLDSHGFIQKLAAEAGILGLAAFFLLVIQGLRFFRTGLVLSRQSKWHEAYVLFLASAAGAVAYQIFNTEYWSGKMWLPIGLALAAHQVLTKIETSPEIATETDLESV